jgi:hypothetical protein
MKNFLLAIGFFTALSTAILVACEKSEPAVNMEPKVMARRGGNGNGGGGGNGSSATSIQDSSAFRDSLFTACGMSWDYSVTPTGLNSRTIQLTNLRTSHVQRVSTGGDGSTYTYDVLVVEFDPVIIPGQTVYGYTLAAGPCSSQCGNYQGQSYCLQGLPTPTARIYLPAPQKNIPIGSQCYGLIKIDTYQGCIYFSQPFTFTSSPLNY